MAFLSLNKQYIAAGETFRLIITDPEGNIGDTLSYTLSGEGLSVSDFVEEISLSGTITLGNNNIGFKDFTTTTDLPTGEEYMTLTVSSPGMSDIFLKVYSFDHYQTVEDKITLGDTFDKWRKKTNNFIARLDNIEDSVNQFRMQTIIADGTSDTFVFNFTAVSSDTYLYNVNIDGVTQDPLVAYTIDLSNNSIVFSEIPEENSSISIVHKYDIGSISYTTTEDGTITPQKLSAGAPSWNIQGDLLIGNYTLRDIGNSTLQADGDLNVTGLYNGYIPAARDVTSPVAGRIAVMTSSGDAETSDTDLNTLLNDVYDLEVTSANTDLNNVVDGSVTMELLSTDIQNSLVGGLSPANYLGEISSLSDTLSDPSTASNKWYFVDGVSGTMTSTYAPLTPIEDGGFIFSDGLTWNTRGASPTYILNGAVSYDKLSSDIQRRNDNLGSRDAIWAITDTEGRSPLYLKDDGKLYFIPEDDIITTSAISDGAVTADQIDDDAVIEDKINNGAVTEDKINNGAVTEDKIGFGAVTEDKIQSNIIVYDKLASDVQRRNDNLSSRYVIWAITDDEGRSPLYLKDDGKLYFIPEDDIITTSAISDDAVTEDKLDTGAVTEDKISSNSVSYNKLASDIQRRADDLVNTRDAIWAITDDEGRAPLCLKADGKLKFIPEADTITGESIKAGEITPDKLAFEISLIDPIDSVTVTKSKETSLYTDSLNGAPSEVDNDQIDWKSFPQYTATGFTVDNTVSTVTSRDLLVRKKNAIPVGHFYMGDWDSSVASHNTTKYWANDIGKLPHPASNTSSAPHVDGLGYRWRSGFWWRIKNTVTINGVTYNQDDVLVYRALLTNTGTVITDPSIHLGWNTYGSTTLVRKGATWDPNESPVNPLDNFTFEYEGECVEVDADGNGYRKGDLVVYKPNLNPNTDQFIVRKTYDVTTISAGATEVFSGAPVDYEYRHDTSAGNPFMFSFKYHSTSKKTLFKSANGDLKLFNEDNGITDDLAELNALDFVQNPKLSENARYVYFYGNAQQGSSNNLALHVFDTQDRVIRADNNRNVTILGDSIANHFFSPVQTNVHELDNANGLTPREFYNHGKGSAQDSHSLEAFKYFLEQDTDVASRILLVVADHGVTFDRSMELFTYLISLMPAHSRRYLFCDMYQDQRELTYNSGLGRFTANNVQDLTAERRFFEAFGNALEGTGNYISYHDMINNTPEAVAYMDSVYDPQFPDFNTQLEVVKEFGCMPWYNAKETGTLPPVPIDSPNDFIGKFQGYLTASDASPSGTATDKYYYLTSELSTRTTDFPEETSALPIGTMIWYDANSSSWIVTKINDIHPGTQARNIIGDVYKRLFSERKWY